MSVDTKKRKWEENRILYRFQTFGDPGCPADFDGAFRDNIRNFLQDFAKRKPQDLENMPAWCVALEVDENQPYQISLLVVEETIGKARRPQCDHCRCIGWSHHLICKKRYHFIVPAQGEGGFSESVLDMQTHLLHGMIHSNGFGHLLSVNGREKGSKYATGGQIMDLWDRICAMLRARKVSVEDLAKKREIELRLLHSVAYGTTWFGRWGFEFGRGSYGINQQTYLKAIEAIRGMPLSVMLQSFQQLDPDLVKIAETYTKTSSNTLQTVGDLVSFMMEFKAGLPFDTKSAIKTTIASPISCITTPCRWSRKRIELATEAIIDCLKRGGQMTWMPRQDVRDGARARIGDTGLLDFVLKSLGNRVVGCHVVRRSVNPVSKVLEYSLQEIQSATTASAVDADVDTLTRDDVWKDIKYVYKHLVENDRPTKNTMLTAIPTAARIILDTKQLIKNYKGEMTRRGSVNQWSFDDDQMLRIVCRVSFDAESAPPPDLVVIPPYSTFGDLKEAAERALRETYHVMRDFQVERLADVEAKDDDLLFGTVDSGSCVVVEGGGIDMDSDWRFEGGVDTWTEPRMTMARE